MKIRILALVFFLLPAAAGARDLEQLQQEIVEAARAAGGTVGVGVRHLPSGTELYLHRGTRFPMASLFKLPLALALLPKVQEGAIALDRIVRLQASDMRPGSGLIARGAPRAMSVRELLEAMLVDSDNTATDLLWKEAGGAQAVMARLELIGAGGINVSRPVTQLMAAAAGLKLPEHAALTPAQFEGLLRKTPRNRRLDGIDAFFKDERDTTTPEAYVVLLTRIWRGETLVPEHTALLLDIMRHAATGRARLRAGLPRGTPLAHKTGTLRPHVVNDAGVISLPAGGQIVIAVLIKESPQDLATQERAIAAIARAAYRHFTP